MRGDAGGALVAKEAAAAIAGTIVSVHIPSERRRRRLVACRVRADEEAAAPLRDAIVDKRVTDDAERVAEEVERAAVRAVGLGARIAVDQISFDRHRVLVERSRGNPLEIGKQITPGRVRQLLGRLGERNQILLGSHGHAAPLRDGAIPSAGVG